MGQVDNFRLRLQWGNAPHCAEVERCQQRNAGPSEYAIQRHSGRILPDGSDNSDFVWDTRDASFMKWTAAAGGPPAIRPKSALERGITLRQLTMLVRSGPPYDMRLLITQTIA